ncbi:Kelch repeat-containing protein [Pseudoroseicyclus tamaricis]|uniref:Kelch-like protein n=1 Tax=Pseudoroseicyclus tamaricis TaxID=2705421 RepID=A0A6B2JNG1_9RHOB|nr:kelch repeat-containing protein [Pseudoroseicyclus tamaricis]NDU99567.1 kelch-like protein [Pseudoroseicyclus tamaricis]
MRARALLPALLAALALAGPARAQEGSWVPGPPLPEARQEIYAEVFEGRIVTAGGFGMLGVPAASAWALDPEAGQWESLPPLPTPRHHVALAAAGGRLYAIGGFTGLLPTWAATDEVLVLGPEGWEPAAPLPEPRGEAVTAVVDGRIHVIGGRVPSRPGADRFDQHEDSAGHVIFDPATGAWSRGPEAPTARNSAAGAVIDGKIYIAGGRQSGPAGMENIAALEVYDPEAERWQSRAPMPQAQGGLAAAALGGRLHVFGGEHFLPRSGVFAEAWSYDPAVNAWEALPPMPVPRHGLAAAALGGRIWLIGGATRPSFGAVRDVSAFTPPP